MDPNNRPSPEDILASLESEGRGRLTVFLGAAAGVGKTYTMLDAAQEALAEGIDVVIGWAETHGRVETEALLEGLPVVPPRSLEYSGKLFSEMDVDAVLQRRPKLVLVDELAHTNIVGSRHKRRYQDVEELLDAGIDVYTTVNIQHLESLNDVVAQITQIPVRETVPDSLLDRAQIRLVDIPSEELLKRLEEGKVYVPDQAELAVKKFFRPGNINALRELTLRYTASAVDRQLEIYRRAHAIEGAWPARELVMACVSASPFSAQVIRTARRLATSLKADWIVAYVEKPGAANAEGPQADQLSKNIRLAEELGAQVVGLTGYEVPAELLDLAHRRNVTDIVIGKPLGGGAQIQWKGSLVDKVIEGSTGMSVHVVPGKPRQLEQAEPPKHRRRLRAVDARPYLAALVGIAALTVACKGLQFGLEPALDLTNIALLYLVPVLFAALRWGRGPAIFSSMVSVLAFDVLFVPPQLSLTVADLRYLVVFAVFLAVGLVISELGSRLRSQEVTTRRREERTTALYALSRQMAAETDMRQLLDAVVRVVGQTLAADVAVFMPGEHGTLVSKAKAASLSGERARAVADWVFTHGESAGKGTETLSGADGLFVPLKTQEKTVGVLAVAPQRPDTILMPDQRQLLEAFATMTAVAVIRLELAAEAREATHAAESERLRTALFNSVSHDLRTPLASITGAVTGLQEEGVYDSAARRELIETVREGAERMDRLVGNLLDSARYESGMLRLNKEWCDVQDILGVALRRTSEVLKERPVQVDVPPGLPLVRADFTLIEQVVINLVYNAVKYSPPKTEVSITVAQTDETIEVSVQDRGPGVPEADRERVFDKFYRLYSPEHVSGTGLGLSISRALVEAHGGRIWVEEAPGGGGLFKFTLSVEEQPVVMEPGAKQGGSDGC